MTARREEETSRRAMGSWLSGTQMPGGENNDYRGEDLGLPASGVGSLATGWQRVLGLLVDWLISYGVAFLILGGWHNNIGTTVLIVWFVIGVLAVSLFGFTPGQYITGMRVARVDFGAERGAAEAAGEVPRAAVGPVRALGRQVLISFVVPALINDFNGRAMHDRATGTALVRTRG
ncbi:RDD family protein [Gordonia sp. HY285]|uniref:RDD family protein n=1 Tax=Gordonia liuliyuniae TaxID=2911517 RepID=UPI001F16E96A|nr:RDD family protein [Gordonia liuliyuniae]MCF8611313.1 RDD family protein [Gordonia liuliyuniae]